MSDTTEAAEAGTDLGADAKPRPNAFVQIAPTPELADVRDRAGAQRGMALALLAGGVFWAAVAAAVVLSRR